MATDNAGIGMLFLFGMLVLPIVGAFWARLRGAKKVALLLATVWVLFWVALLAPGFISIRATARKHACVANLKHLEDLKYNWAAKTKPAASTIPQPFDLAPFLKGNLMPTCPFGGTYTVGAVNEPSRCSLHDQVHKVPKE